MDQDNLLKITTLDFFFFQGLFCFKISSLPKVRAVLISFDFLYDFFLIFFLNKTKLLVSDQI